MDDDKLKTKCPECGNVGDVPKWWSGNLAQCKECGEPFVVHGVEGS